MEVLHKQSNTFKVDQIKEIISFSDILKRIHIRLISEGYKIEKGKIIPPNNKKSDNIK